MPASDIRVGGVGEILDQLLEILRRCGPSKGMFTPPELS